MWALGAHQAPNAGPLNLRSTGTIAALAPPSRSLPARCLLRAPVSAFVPFLALASMSIRTRRTPVPTAPPRPSFLQRVVRLVTGKPIVPPSLDWDIPIENDPVRIFFEARE
jgi:hypothetical protein